ETGEVIELHFSIHLPDGLWTVELRRIAHDGTKPLLDASAGEGLRLAAGGRVVLRAPYIDGHAARDSRASNRLWRASVLTPGTVADFLQRHGFPIRYGYVRQPWPIAAYQ